MRKIRTLVRFQLATLRSPALLVLRIRFFPRGRSSESRSTRRAAAPESGLTSVPERSLQLRKPAVPVTEVRPRTRQFQCHGKRCGNSSRTHQDPRSTTTRRSCLVETVLEKAGFRVLLAKDGGEGLDRVIEHSPQLIILDVSLPGGSGLDMCRELRTWYKAPILMLSAHGEEEIMVSALDLGADDYVTKPFRPGELSARVRMLLRRAAKQPVPGSVSRIGALELDRARRRLLRKGVEVPLTRTEFDILACLIENLDCVVTDDSRNRLGAAPRGIQPNAASPYRAYSEEDRGRPFPAAVRPDRAWCRIRFSIPDQRAAAC